MTRRRESGQPRFRYEPLLNLRTGRIVGWEAIVPPRERPAVLAEQYGRTQHEVYDNDLAMAIAATQEAFGRGSSAAVHVNLLADTAVHAGRRLRMLADLLERAGRPASQLVLEINPPLWSAPANRLVDAIAVLRQLGIRVAYDAAEWGFGTAVLSWGSPQLVKIGGRVSRCADEWGMAAIAGLRATCEAAGVPLAATGVDDAQVSDRLRRSGVEVVQGPVFATDCLAPNLSALPADAQTAALVGTAHGRQVTGGIPRARRPEPSRVRGLAHNAFTLPMDAAADEARALFADHADASGIVLIGTNGNPKGYLHRDRFLLAIAGPYGRALYANRAAADLAEPPRTLPVNCSVPEALHAQRSGEQGRQLDDFVLVDERGQCAGTLKVTDLLTELDRQHTGLPEPG